MAKKARKPRARGRKGARTTPASPEAAPKGIGGLSPSVRRDLFQAVNAILEEHGVDGRIRELHLGWKEAASGRERCRTLPSGKVVCD